MQLLGAGLDEEGMGSLEAPGHAPAMRRHHVTPYQWPLSWPAASERGDRSEIDNRDDRGAHYMYRQAGHTFGH